MNWTKKESSPERAKRQPSERHSDQEADKEAQRPITLSQLNDTAPRAERHEIDKSKALFDGHPIPSGQEVINLYNQLRQSNPNIYNETRKTVEVSKNLPVLYLSPLELQELKSIKRVYYIDPVWDPILNANLNNQALADAKDTGNNGHLKHIDMDNIFQHVQVRSCSLTKGANDNTILSKSVSKMSGLENTLNTNRANTDTTHLRGDHSSFDQVMKYHPNSHTNSHGEYTATMEDSHIAFRYRIKQILGKGSFGMCLRVEDYGEKMEASANKKSPESSTSYLKCLKLLRAKPRVTNQGKTEVHLLSYILQKDPCDTANLIRMERNFMVLNHLAIVFELLSMNLYELICRYMKSSYGSGGPRCMPLSLIRKLSVQILNGLLFLHSHKIIHADIKPENILLKNPTKSGIKIIDLGSSCFIDERIYSYIQSRFYRAPEVMMGYPYDYGIDIWSMGCVLAELYTGRPLFPGENEADQMRIFIEILGRPSERYIQMGPRAREFFDHGELKPVCFGNRKHILHPRPLESILNCDDRLFVDFLKKCFIWDPKERMTAESALDHPWMVETIRMLREGVDAQKERNTRTLKLPNINKC